MDNKPIMLIADERDDIRKDLCEFFVDDYEIVEKKTGADALSFLHEATVCIILCAFDLPDLQGAVFLDALKQKDALRDIPVLSIINEKQPQNGALAIMHGAADYLSFPFYRMIVRRRVHNVIARVEIEWYKQESTENERQIHELQKYMEIDLLTGLYTRNAFYEKAARKIHENPTVKYSIVYLDISSFKVVNDLFDLETGTLVLQTAGCYFQLVVAGIGLGARLEADHFVLLIPQERLDEDTLLEGVDATLEALNIHHKIIFYAGIYHIEDTHLAVNQMVDRAHMALQKIKSNVFTRTKVYDDSMRENLLLEQKVTRDMDIAIAEHQFFIVLQPIYSLLTGHIVGAETLVRWKHPVEGMISPSVFVPVLERTGFVVRLDHFVWEEACKFLRSRLDRGEEILPISVNVSRLNFYYMDLIFILVGLLDKYELDSRYLKLELTESAYTDNPDRIIRYIKELRELGFPVLMDDFGSGYSSLNMLKNLPVDILKIDMGFLQDFEKTPRTGKIIRIVVELARSLDTDVVVEGVETQAQIDFLRSIGCDQIQGYYFSKPLPISEFEELLRNDRAAQAKEREEGSHIPHAE